MGGPWNRISHLNWTKLRIRQNPSPESKLRIQPTCVTKILRRIIYMHTVQKDEIEIKKSSTHPYQITVLRSV